MIFSLEVQDSDLRYVQKNLRHGRFTLDRWSDEDGAACSRLMRAGVIFEEMHYHSDSICYNPSYKLTELGEKVFEQYLGQA